MRDFCDDAPRVICINERKVAHLRAALPDDGTLEREAGRLKALAHPGRLTVLHLLAQEECCVCDVAHTLRTPVSTASQHLRRLQRAGLLDSRRDGKLVFYALSDDGRELLQFLAGGASVR